jgi:hypothetical protein
MTPTHTAGTLAALIERRREPDTADIVLAALRSHNGQLITTRLLDKLPGGRVEWRLARTMGWTEIVNGAYRKSQGNAPDGLRLIIARSEASVPLDVAWVERENPAYFAGRRERNALRDQALADPSLLTRLATVMNEIEDLRYKLTFAEQTFFELADGPAGPDRYELERACGMRKESR